MLTAIKSGLAASYEFCWLDLAATDATTARQFYRQMFGWTTREQAANGGFFTLLQHTGRDVASLYQLSKRHLDCNVSSHWLPYVRVENIDDAVQRTIRCGGQVIVRPFAVDGIARIALIVDSVGAQVGLWEPATSREEVSNDS